MKKTSLTALAQRHMQHAKGSPTGRSSETVHGGHEHVLSQTLIAMTAGATLGKHHNPGEGTFHVLSGKVTLQSVDRSWSGSPGDLLFAPVDDHALTAVEDSAILFTYAKPSQSL
jgi:quercetin dioxygenase-like cupin family protein